MNDEEKVLNEYINLTKKNVCKIDFNKGNVSIMDDKIGGVPYLPVGEEYPLDGEGNKMGLFLQVNLEHVQLKEFPKKGILEVFISTNERIFSYETDGNLIIKLYESGLEYQKDIEYVELPFLGGSYKLSIQNSEVVRSLDDKGEEILNELIRKYNINKTAKDFDDKMWDLAYINSYIGGYPNINMHDPNNYYISNDEECLFYIDTDKFVDMGDTYAMFMTIHKDDLENERFDRAEFNIAYY